MAGKSETEGAWKRIWTGGVKAARWILILVAIVAVSLVVDFCAYSSPEWKEYKAFNAARTDIYDFDGLPPYDEYRDLYEENGFSFNEYRALEEEFGLVKELDSNRLGKLALVSKELNKDSFSYRLKNATKDFLGESVEMIKQPIGLLNLMMLIVLFVVLFGKAEAGGISFYMHCVRSSLISCVALGLVLIARDVEMERKYVSYVINYGLAAVVFVLCLLLIPRKAKLSEGNWYWKLWYVKATEAINEICRNNPDNIYFVEHRLANIESVAAEGVNTELIPGNCVPLVFWTAKSPLAQERLERAGIVEPVETLMNGENVYFIAFEDYEFLWLEEMCLEYGGAIKEEPEDKLELDVGTIVIYRIN